MENAIFEIVKEYRLDIVELEFPIRSRVVKRVSQDDGLDYRFEWEISHYCQLTESAAGAYIPSSPYGDSFEGVESQLLAYMKSFTMHGVVANEYY